MVDAHPINRNQGRPRTLNNGENLSIDMESVIPFDDLDANDALDSHFIQTFEANDRELRTNGWSVRERYFGLGIPELVALYLLRVTPTPPENAEWVWFVVSPVLGNAVLNSVAGSHPLDALDTYLTLMESVADEAMNDSIDTYDVGEPAGPQIDKERAAVVLETIYEIRGVISEEGEEEEEE